MLVLPRLYAILDTNCFLDAEALLSAAHELSLAGCTLLQYRNKSGNARVMLDHTRELKKLFAARGTTGDAPDLAGVARSGSPITLIMNDRADLSLAADFNGVHVGQDDLSPESVRKIIGPNRLIGVSTHNPEQLREADLTSADYLAIGPVFGTTSKEKPDPVVGLEGVRRARTLTSKPLVAIGGITRANAASVIEAGADSVAVISDLIRDPRKSAEEFFRILR
jgi:thiamine-phosphate pyrophosphorylase